MKFKKYIDNKLKEGNLFEIIDTIIYEFNEDNISYKEALEMVKYLREKSK